MFRTTVLVFLLLTILAGASGFPLVDGERCAVVVVADSTATRKPAELLQEMVYRSTGKRLPLLAEKDYQKGNIPTIFLGRTSYTLSFLGKKLESLDRDGYIIDVKPDKIFLAGATDQSCLWAVGDFLRVYLGIDSYFPADCGLVIPKHKQVIIPVGTRLEQPAFKSRAFSALNTNRGTRSLPEMPWRIQSGHGRYSFHHNLHTFITVEEFGHSHPEYFAYRNGRRQIVSSSAGPNPCLSNPEVVRIVTEKCRKFFDSHPEAETISLGMTDGGWCECENCKAQDSPSQEILGRRAPKSGYYYRFLNQVAAALKESHPGKFIGVLGYAGAEFPPNFRVERNIIPYLCYSRANWYNPEAKKLDLALTRAWLEKVERIGVYEYLYGSPYSIPRLYTKNLTEYLRFVAEKCPGSGFYAEVYANNGLDGPKSWITEKIIWNPRQNPDKLLRQWCQAVFEEAAAPMESYFRYLENTWNRNGMKATTSLGKLALYGDDKQLEIFTPEDVAVCWQKIEAARKLAKTREVKDRIEYFASTFKITDLSVKKYHAYKKVQQMLETGKDGRTLLEALLKADNLAPKKDVKQYSEEIQKSDATKFMGGVEIKTSTEICVKIVSDLVWKKILDILQSGEKDVKSLRKIAGVIISETGKNFQDEVSQKRLKELISMGERIAPAWQVNKPPKIDGELNDACWIWQDDTPWFAWKSGQPADVKTSYSFLWDDNFLYVAFRCLQPGIKDFPLCRGQGAPAWRYPSMEIFLNPDASQAQLADPFRYAEEGPEKVRLMQIIIARGGGTWERDQQALVESATKSNEDSWQAELKISWSKLNFGPGRYRFLRLNLVRNTGTGGQSSVTWFPSTGAHASYQSRGWLIFTEAGGKNED